MAGGSSHGLGADVDRKQVGVAEGVQQEIVTALTIVVPTYKRPGMLNACLRSIREQTHQDFRVLVCDNSELGEGRPVVEALGDDRFDYIQRDRNIGIFGNAIAGFRAATTEFVMEVDDDDRLKPAAVEALLAPLLSDRNLALSFADVDVVDDEGRVLTGVDRSDFLPPRTGLTAGRHQPFTDIAARGDIFLMSTILRRDAIDWSAIPAGVATAYDRYLTLAASRGGRPAYFIDDNLVEYRVHAGSTMSRASVQLAGCLVALEHELALSDPRHRRVLRSELSRGRVALAQALAIEQGLSEGVRAAMPLLRPTALGDIAHAAVTEYIPERLRGAQGGIIGRNRRRQRRMSAERDLGRGAEPNRRLALLGYLGSGNLGNDASAAVVISWLRQQAPEVKITVLTDAPEVIRARHGVDSMPMSVCPPKGVPGIRHRVHRLIGRFCDVPRTFRWVKSVDAVVIPGMGVFEESLPVGPWGFPSTLLLAGVAARAYHRPFILLAIGAEPAANPKLDRVFSLTCRLATHVSCRDFLSQRTVEAWTGRRHEVVPDIAFAHALPPTPMVHANQVAVGVMGGDFEHAYSSTRPMITDYVVSMTALVNAIREAGYSVVLTHGDRADDKTLHEIQRRCVQAKPNAPTSLDVALPEDFADLARTIGEGSVVVASRYHNLVCGLSVARPTISLSYAEKCDELLSAFGLPHAVHDIRNLDVNHVIAQVNGAVGTAQEVIPRIRYEREEASRHVANLLDRVLGPLTGGVPGRTVPATQVRGRVRRWGPSPGLS